MDKKEINPRIYVILEENNIPKDEGVLVLLAIYHDLQQTLSFDDKYELIYKQLNQTGIVTRKYSDIEIEEEILKEYDDEIEDITVEESQGIHKKRYEVIWNIPLYKVDYNNNDIIVEEEDDWDWVKKEYRPLFTSRNPARSGSLKSCILRMKEFFATHPQVRKDDIIDAVKIYLERTRNSEYIMSADYFIKKDKGKNERSLLEAYLEILKEKRKEEKLQKEEQNKKFLR